MSRFPPISARPVAAWMPFLGTFRDQSGGGFHSTPTAMHWRNVGGVDGIMPDGSTAKLAVADDVLLRLPALSVFLYSAGGLVQAAADQIIVDRGAAQYQLRLQSTGVRMTGASVNSDLAVTYGAAKSIAATLAAGAVPTFYLDGASVGVGDSVLTPGVAANAMTLLGDGSLPMASAGQVGLLYSGELAAADVAALDAWADGLITPRKQWPGAGLRYPNRETNLLPDGDMNNATVAPWLATNATLSKETDDPPEGSRYLKILNATGGAISCWARQTGLLDATQRYRVRGQARTDGIATAKVVLGGSTTLSATTNSSWTRFDVNGKPTGGTTFYLGQDSMLDGGFVYFDDVTIWAYPPGYTPATGDPMFLDNFQTARVSVANETSGQLSNTELEIITGTWQLKEDAVGRYASCIGTGQLKRTLVGASAMTTRVFTATGTAALTKNAATIEIDASAGEEIRALVLEAA